MGLEEKPPGETSAYSEFAARAYRLPSTFAGETVSGLERRFQNVRVFVQRIRRGNRVLAPNAGERLEDGDIVALLGRRSSILLPENPLSPYETEDRELLDFPTTTLDVIITNKLHAGKTLAELQQSEASRGVFLNKLTRQGVELPFTAHTVIERGDVLTLSGFRAQVEAVAASGGYVDRPTSETDMSSVGLVIVVGGLIGLLALKFGKLEIGLSMSVGALIGG
jgi:putative transport protein